MPRSHKAFSLGPLGGHKVHKMVKFRPRGMVDKREMEQAQLFETADERGCTPMFGAAHRRASAVPYPRRDEDPSLLLVSRLIFIFPTPRGWVLFGVGFFSRPIAVESTGPFVAFSFRPTL